MQYFKKIWNLKILSKSSLEKIKFIWKEGHKRVLWSHIYNISANFPNLGTSIWPENTTGGDFKWPLMTSFDINHMICSNDRKPNTKIMYKNVRSWGIESCVGAEKCWNIFWFDLRVFFEYVLSLFTFCSTFLRSEEFIEFWFLHIDLVLSKFTFGHFSSDCT